MEIATIKHLSLQIAKIGICFLAFLFILSKCSGCEHKVILTSNDSINKVIQGYKLKLIEYDVKLSLANEANDSLSRLKKKVEVKYIASSKSVRNDLAHGVCDTVKIIETLNDCDSIISLDNKVIAVKDTIISYQTEYISTQKSIIASKDEAISNKDKDIKALKKEVRKQRIKTISAIIGGALTTGLAIFVLR